MKSGERDWSIFTEYFSPQISTWLSFDIAGMAVSDSYHPVHGESENDSYLWPTKASIF